MLKQTKILVRRIPWKSMLAVVAARIRRTNAPPPGYTTLVSAAVNVPT